MVVRGRPHHSTIGVYWSKAVPRLSLGSSRPNLHRSKGVVLRETSRPPVFAYRKRQRTRTLPTSHAPPRDSAAVRCARMCQDSGGWKTTMLHRLPTRHVLLQSVPKSGMAARYRAQRCMPGHPTSLCHYRGPRAENPRVRGFRGGEAADGFEPRRTVPPSPRPFRQADKL
jgi:hypothetical protein